MPLVSRDQNPTALIPEYRAIAEPGLPGRIDWTDGLAAERVRHMRQIRHGSAQVLEGFRVGDAMQASSSRHEGFPEIGELEEFAVDISGGGSHGGAHRPIEFGPARPNHAAE